MISPPEFAVSVLDTLSAAGFSAYFVGGCVRDTMMSRRVSDWDAAASALPHEVMALFRKTAPTGIRYGTVTVFCGENKVEVTSFRQEAGYDGRRPAAVRFGADISRDLSRRDFTVNAMAMGARGGIIDPFGGMADIERRLIRAVGAPSVRFCEDALRMLRALRFSAQLGFAIERETRAAIRECAHLARALSRERVRDELTKTLLSEKPETAAEIIALGLLAPTVPEANPDLAELPALPAELPLRLALLMRRLRDCGAVSDPVTTLRALKYPRAVCESAGIGARACCGASRFGIKSAIARHGYATGRCAAACEGALAEYDDVIGSGECCTLSQLAVGGADLLAAGIQPGRTVGKTLDALLCHVIGNAEDNTRDTLLKLI